MRAAATTAKPEERPGFTAGRMARSTGLHGVLLALVGAGGLVAFGLTRVDAALAATGLALVGLAFLTVHTSYRLRRLRSAALDVAHRQLPEAVGRITAAAEPDAVRAAVADSAAQVDRALARKGEAGALAAALAAAHRRALGLAADEALTRMETEASLAALARRGQTLVERQLRLVDEFLRVEVDPAARGRLLVLDRIAARIRRNDENLLLLAGAAPGPPATESASLRDVIRMAADELDDPERVRVMATPLVAIAAPAVGDVAHLLAELLENAANFSHPANTIRVDSHQGVDQITVTVVDVGIGMPAARLADANRRLAEPSALTGALAGTRGLLVVGRLARRHGISVRLSSVPDGGTAAFVVLPQRVLGPPPTLDRVRRPRYEPPALAAVPASPPRPAIAERAALPALPAGPVAGSAPLGRPPRRLR
ncbi:ATP-binding protein [Actinomycetes bacterium KLBMP 9797]